MHKELKCIEIEVHQVFAQVQTLNQRFVSSIGNIEKAIWVFNYLGWPGLFWAVLKKIGPIMSNFWGRFFHVFFRGKKYFDFFKNFVLPMKIESMKKPSSKVAHSRPKFFFSTANQPKSQFLSHQNWPSFSWSIKIISRLIINKTTTHNSSKMYLIL